MSLWHYTNIRKTSFKLSLSSTIQALYKSSQCNKHQLKLPTRINIYTNCIHRGGNWSVRHPDPVIEILEAWLPLLPEWVIRNILEQLVLPSLTAEVETWNPLTDTMPIHAWVHPWLPFMSEYSRKLLGCLIGSIDR